MAELPNAVQRFLDGMRTGDWDGMEQHFTPDALHDGSMPDWRLQYEGPARIVQALREEWTGQGGWNVIDPVVTASGDTVVVEVHGTRATPDGEQVVCRMANVFALRDGRIAEHRYYCCGEWSEAAQRQIEAEAPKVERKVVPA